MIACLLHILIWLRFATRCYGACAIDPDVKGHVNIPGNWTEIPMMAFAKCSGLKSVFIPSSIDIIHPYAFKDNEDLVDVEIADGSVESIRQGAFSKTGIKSINLGDNIKYLGIGVFMDCTSLTSFSVPNSVETMGHSVFMGATALKSVILNSKIKTLRRRTFEACTSLNAIDFGGLSAIGDDAFKGTGFTSLSIPDTIIHLNDSAFEGCRSLTEVTIPGSVKIIGDSAFAYCYNLASITVSEGVEIIGSSAFAYNSRIQTITLPSSAGQIGSFAFMFTTLHSITITADSVNLDDGAFAKCMFLKNVSFLATKQITVSKTTFVYSDDVEIYLMSDLQSSSGIESVTCDDGLCGCTRGFGNPLSESSKFFTCQPCSAGHTSNGDRSACSPCQAGRWASAMATKECTPCAKGTYSTEEGSIIDSCQACPAGKYAPAAACSSCIECPPGNYCPRPGMASYLQCEPGSYMPSKGQLSCHACDAGKFTSTNGSAICEDCARGKYLVSEGATAETSCVACPTGRYGDKTGLSSCMPCVTGNYCPRVGLSIPLQCAPGTYTSQEGQTICKSCGVGKYTPHNGSVVCEDCPMGKFLDTIGASENTSCQVCPAGRFGSQVGLNECQDCSLGHYQSNEGQRICYACRLQGELMTNAPDFKSCVLNKDLLSESVAEMLFSDGIALYVGFIITALFVVICGAMQYLREKQLDDLGQLQRWQVLVKSALPGFAFGSELMLIIGIYAESPILGSLMLTFRCLQSITFVFITICIFGHKWTRPYVRALVEDVDEWKAALHHDFTKANIPVVGATLILCMSDVSLVQMLPWKSSQFYRDSQGFPKKSLMTLCLGVDVFQATASVICQIIYLVTFKNEDEPTTEPQAKALFAMNITVALLTATQGVFMMVLKQRLLKDNNLPGSTTEDKAEMSHQNHLHIDEQRKNGESEKRGSVTLELEALYQDRFEKDSSHSNPLLKDLARSQSFQNRSGNPLHNLNAHTVHTYEDTITDEDTIDTIDTIPCIEETKEDRDERANSPDVDSESSVEVNL